MQRRARLEGIAQLLGRGAQARVRERRQGGRIRFAVRQRLQHAAGADAQQVGHEAGHLDVRFLEQRLQPVVELHAVARDLVLAAHHGPPEPLLGVGHKAQGQLLRDQALHQPLRIREVLLAAAGPAIRLRLGEMERARRAARAPSRARRRGRQCCSSASHTGRQYCAVDSMTTSSTSRSTSQSARRAQIGRASSRPSGVRSGSRRRPRRRPPRPPASSCARQFPRSGTASASPRGSGERASSHQSGSRAIVGPRRNATTLNYSVNHARSGSNSCSASTGSMANLDLAAPSAAILPIATIFILFRGPQAQPQPVAEIVPNTQPRNSPCVFNDLQHRVICAPELFERPGPPPGTTASTIASLPRSRSEIARRYGFER